VDSNRLTRLILPAAVPAQVRVWQLDVAQDEVRLAGLDHAERERCLRYRHHADRVRFAETRLALRALLAGRLGVTPDAVAFTLGVHGKPLLAGGGLQFNVSHSGRYALIAISTAEPVGIDLERIDRERPLHDLAERYYSPAEQAACLADPDAFFHLWSCKEALAKARGTGIGDGLPALDSDRSRVWRIAAPDGYAAALAIA